MDQTDLTRDLKDPMLDIYSVFAITWFYYSIACDPDELFIEDKKNKTTKTLKGDDIKVG